MNQAEEPTCMECGEYLTGFPLKHKQHLCSDCQEVLDGPL